MSKDVAREWWIGTVKSLWPIMLARTESGEIRQQSEIQRIVEEKMSIMEGVCSISHFLKSEFLGVFIHGREVMTDFLDSGLQRGEYQESPCSSFAGRRWSSRGVILYW